MQRIFVFIAVASCALVVALGAPAATANDVGDPATWTTTTIWHIPPAPGADYIIKRQIGTSYGDTPDDTIPVKLIASGSGDTITTHSSPWTPIDASQFGVPAGATAVRLQFKAVITGTPNSESTVYAFVKTDGSSLCSGPTGYENYPVDFTWDGEPQGGGEKCWAVHASIDGSNGVREFNTVEVPLTNGKFDFAWGYRKTTGTWPNGSAVAVDVWLDGWAS